MPGHHVFFGTHDVTFCTFTDFYNKCCAQVPIVLLERLLLNTLFYPKTEILIILGLVHWSLAKTSHVFLEQNHFGAADISNSQPYAFEYLL